MTKTKRSKRKRNVLGIPGSQESESIVEIEDYIRSIEYPKDLAEIDKEIRLLNMASERLARSMSIVNQSRIDLGLARIKLQESLSKERRVYINRSYDLKSDFRTRWFLWRSVVDVSRVTRVTHADMLYGDGDRKYRVERSLAIWIAKKTGDLSTTELSRVLDRGKSSIFTAIRFAEREVDKVGSPHRRILLDILYQRR